MKGIIIYRGKYGATEQYANWLAEALNLPVLKTDFAIKDIVDKYEVVIMGSSVYVGQLLIKQWLKQHRQGLLKKQLYLFIVSASTSHDELLQQQVISNNLDPELRNRVKVFFVPGRCRRAALSWTDRLMLKMGAWLEKDPQKKALMQSDFDDMDKTALDALIKAVGK